MRNYKRILTHGPAILSLIAVGLRMLGYKICVEFMQMFFSIYKDNYEFYNKFMIPSVIICSVLTNMISGYIVEAYGS